MSNEITRTGQDGTAALAVSDEMSKLLKSMGMKPTDVEGIEQVQTGGLTKWIDLRAFQKDPNAGQGVAVAGNGQGFAGILIGRQEIEDEENGELNADGVKVRYFYNLKLVTPCPVSYKNENKEEVKEIAQPGEIIAVGERAKLAMMREWSEDGGTYLAVIRPHSRIKIQGGRTMWTFDMWKKVIKPPMKVRAELVAARAPF